MIGDPSIQFSSDDVLRMIGNTRKLLETEYVRHEKEVQALHDVIQAVSSYCIHDKTREKQFPSGWKQVTCLGCERDVTHLQPGEIRKVTTPHPVD